jgi:tRNA(Ile)-lysidine synthase
LEQEVNPRAVEHMNETMEHLRQVQEYLELQTEAYWKKCVKQTKEGFLVEKDEFELVPDVLKTMLLKRVLGTVANQEKDLESVHLQQLQELFSKQTGRRVDLPYDVEGRRVYQGVVLCKKKPFVDELVEEQTFSIQRTEAIFNIGDMQIRCKVINEKSFEKSNTGWFDCDIIKSDLCFRTRREGDFITIHPDGRTQKLKSYFINEKIPKEERDRILLVADGSHILWIVGYRKNCLYQAKEETKNILESQINKVEEYERENSSYDI